MATSNITHHTTPHHKAKRAGSREMYGVQYIRPWHSDRGQESENKREERSLGVVTMRASLVTCHSSFFSVSAYTVP